MELSNFNQKQVDEILKFDPRVSIFIVSCSKEKIWDEQTKIPTYINAEKAYTGEKFKKFLEWYQTNGFRDLGYFWIILSGKYGFIEPDHPISWYDIDMSNPEYYPISTESLQNQVKQLRKWRKKGQSDNFEIRLQDFETVICVNCNDTYTDNIKKCFKDKNLISIEDIIYNK